MPPTSESAPAAPSAALSPGLLCVAEYANNTLAVADPATGEILQRIAAGQNPATALVADGWVYVGSSGGGEVTAVNIRSDGFDDRCALYLRVLDDLWDVDGGLNGDITMASVDLSQTSLSESEQAAVAWAFAGKHGISDPLTLSYAELAAEGYLTDAESDSDGIPCWEEGCLFVITEQAAENNARNGAGDTVTFDAQKWRSALGAYFFCDCTASQDIDGRWGDYTVGSQAIS